MAQFGSAHAWGAWGRRFKSCHPDFSGLLSIYLMGISKKLISKKKPFYPISEELKLFLKDHDRWMENVISYDDLLILQDGHCFRNQVLNLCTLDDLNKQYELKSGSFETLINLSNNGPWMTIIPYLHSNNLSSKNIQNIIPFEDPAPAREISMIYSKSQLKLPVINALMDTISSVIRGQIKYNDIKIMSPASV